MSHSPTVARPPGTDGESDRVDGDDVEPLLEALEDGDCRAILQATSSEALSASELSETCDLPLSTTYRKVDVLTEAGLLEEQIRLCSSGKHTSEYALCIEDIHLSLGTDNGVELEITRRNETDPAASMLAGAD